MTVTSSVSSYRTNTIYYPKSNYLTSTKIMESKVSSSSSTTTTATLVRTHAYSVFSPPELVHDDEEEDEEDPSPLPASPPTTPPSCLIMNQHRILKNSISASPITKRRKCIPHRSPSSTPSNDWIFTWPPPTTTSTMILTSSQPPISFIPQQEQQYQKYSYQPRIVYLRHRRTTDPMLKSPASSSTSLESPLSSSSPSSSLPFPRRSTVTSTVVSPTDQYSTAKSVSETSSSLHSAVSSPAQQFLPPSSSSIIPFHQQHLNQDDPMHADMNTHNNPATSTTAFSSGRPIRLKGPCQACHENSEACMRKAFNWPFPSDEVYYDKGRPFVYLCNKCGLRYNKSGGSVCRQCRWVLCKEEKRKVIQLIDAMRSSRPDGQISLDENITSFVCTPKYWNCGQPWKVRWVMSDLVDIDGKQ